MHFYSWRDKVEKRKEWKRTFLNVKIQYLHGALNYSICSYRTKQKIINLVLLKTKIFYTKVIDGRFIICLSGNINAISLLEKHLDKIYWPNLSSNNNAISILEKNQDKLYFAQLSRNKTQEKYQKTVFFDKEKNTVEYFPDKVDNLFWCIFIHKYCVLCFFLLLFRLIW